ncbi:MAG: GNAT family N-acetyltransferase [Caldilineaceae bacterium]|nr:GNAT family N-acetyltransferase [Caldilineaceae bacterium]
MSMVRPTLTNLPSFSLPAPYSLRWYQPGDEAAWVAIHVAADPFHTFTAATFAQEFAADRALLPTRQAYLCDSTGAPVGTTSAWFYTDEEGDAYGLVHWVALHPDHQGRGLAKPLLALVCHQLQELGHARAYLNTSTARLPAIRLYLQFGFVPQMRRDRAATRQAWQEVQTQLAHPAIDDFLAAPA